MRDPLSIAEHEVCQFEMLLDPAIGMVDRQFINDLAQDRLQIRWQFFTKHYAAAETPASKIHHAIDQLGHAVDASLHHPLKLGGVLRRSGREHQSGAGRERGQRVTQVVAERR